MFDMRMRLKKSTQIQSCFANVFPQAGWTGFSIQDLDITGERVT